MLCYLRAIHLSTIYIFVCNELVYLRIYFSNLNRYFLLFSISIFLYEFWYIIWNHLQLSHFGCISHPSFGYLLALFGYFPDQKANSFFPRLPNSVTFYTFMQMKFLWYSNPIVKFETVTVRSTYLTWHERLNVHFV